MILQLYLSNCVIAFSKEDCIISKLIKEFDLSLKTTERGINIYTTEWCILALKNRHLDKAIIEWPRFKDRKEYLTKKMLSFHKKVCILLNDMGMAMSADPEIVTN